MKFPCKYKNQDIIVEVGEESLLFFQKDVDKKPFKALGYEDVFSLMKMDDHVTFKLFLDENNKTFCVITFQQKHVEQFQTVFMESMMIFDENQSDSDSSDDEDEIDLQPLPKSVPELQLLVRKLEGERRQEARSVRVLSDEVRSLRLKSDALERQVEHYRTMSLRLSKDIMDKAGKLNELKQQKMQPARSPTGVNKKKPKILTPLKGLIYTRGGKKKVESMMSEEYIVSKNKFVRFSETLKKTKNVLVDFINTGAMYSQCEMALGKTIEEQANEPFFMGEKEDEKRKLVLKAGNTLSRISEERNAFQESIRNKVLIMLGQISENFGTFYEVESKYVSTLQKMKNLQLKKESASHRLEKNLTKTEESLLQGDLKIKDREKKLKKEDDILKKIKSKEEEFEGFKQRGAFIEQMAIDEVEYQLKIVNNEYLRGINDIFTGFEKYMKKMGGLVKTVREELDASSVNLSSLGSKSERKETKVDKSTLRKLWKPVGPTKIFEVALEEILKREGEGGRIPRVVDELFATLEKSVCTEGLFRVPGRTSEIESLRKRIDRGEGLPHVLNVHSHASLLKKFVRDVPTPFFGFTTLEKRCGRLKKGSKEVLEGIKEEFMKLERPKKDLLHRLLMLLKMVADEKANLMTTSALAKIFWMNICSPEIHDPKEQLKIFPKIFNYVELMIVNVEEFKLD